MTTSESYAMLDFSENITLSTKAKPLLISRTDKWVVCNDELIEKPDKKKRRRLDPGESSDYTSCDQAYMLVYRLEKEVSPMQPSRAIMDKVEEDNATLETEMNDRKFQ